jgi:hypothetical protein
LGLLLFFLVAVSGPVHQLGGRGARRGRPRQSVAAQIVKV